MALNTPIITVTPNTAVDRLIEVPGLATGQHLDGRILARYPAGKGYNVSHALAQIGCPSVATGWVGGDELSMFESFLEDIHDRCGQAQLVPTLGPTRENLTLIDSLTHTELHVRTEGFSVTGRDLAKLDARLRMLTGPGSIVAVCGSRPNGCSITDLKRLLQPLADSGARTALDLAGDDLQALLGIATGGDPQSTPQPADPSSAPKPDQTGTIPSAAGLPARQATAPSPIADYSEPPLVPWLISPNRQELEQMLNRPLSPDSSDWAKTLLQLGRQIEWVVVSSGESGAWLVHNQKIWQASLTVPRQAVRQSVGCGDCLLAGLLSILSTEDDPEKALIRGVACAVANLTAARLAQFTMTDVANLESDVRITSLDG